MIPKKVHETITNFVAKQTKESTVIGIFLVGSYATGQFTETSDIDLKIILSPCVQKRVKGVEISNGFHISYTSYSVMDAYNHFYTQLRTYSKFQARMLSQGKILHDATGEMKHLQNEATLVMQLDFIPQANTTLQLEAYNLWKYKDALTHTFLKRFTLKEFHVFLDKILILYAKLLGIECVFQYPFFKMEQYISDATFRAAYDIPEFPDKVFLKAFQKGITQTTKTDIAHTVIYLFGSIEAKLDMNFEEFEIAN
ncbi:nucleotidyltransferase domain-containing protein [Kordia jejudonensis]|uniref:nucleotidyltransferase domain-containing protein n=1 Tax=Kordia jejudonensis TaxID=1348245 RepID=UPI000629A857|nr:nucleotidyltransferase domain-containing protein [Kordia jejudonensis]